MTAIVRKRRRRVAEILTITSRKGVKVINVDLDRCSVCGTKWDKSGPYLSSVAPPCEYCMPLHEWFAFRVARLTEMKRHDDESRRLVLIEKLDARFARVEARYKFSFGTDEQMLDRDRLTSELERKEAEIIDRTSFDEWP